MQRKGTAFKGKKKKKKKKIIVQLTGKSPPSLKRGGTKCAISRKGSKRVIEEAKELRRTGEEGINEGRGKSTVI